MKDATRICQTPTVDKQLALCGTSDFRRRAGESFSLPGCYAVYVGSCLPTSRDNICVPSWTAWPLKV